MSTSPTRHHRLRKPAWSDDGWQAAEPDPDLEPEQPLPTDDSHDDEPDLAAAAIAGMALEGATDETGADRGRLHRRRTELRRCGPRGYCWGCDRPLGGR